MSLHEYHASQLIRKHDYPFYALIMAAMRQADSNNIQKLSEAFPDIYIELDARYNAPGGIIEGDPEHEQ